MTKGKSKSKTLKEEILDIELHRLEATEETWKLACKFLDHKHSVPEDVAERTVAVVIKNNSKKKQEKGINMIRPLWYLDEHSLVTILKDDVDLFGMYLISENVGKHFIVSSRSPGRTPLTTHSKSYVVGVVAFSNCRMLVEEFPSSTTKKLSKNEGQKRRIASLFWSKSTKKRRSQFCRFSKSDGQRRF
ncbi:hypothetical protein H5410_004289 [Solanum commersonii]|uniref:Uncharacterized protein n=1 Tax=Solanum commersonii TaxID=4109 RepID=A0A9J6B7P7_SOLCO|nr:hypothetical protein H5410_004289 [Solanum commersonii]